MKTKHLRLMQRTYIILFFGFMYLPIAYMILFSFNESKGYALFTGFTLKWYQSLLHNSSILRALAVSVEVALVSSVVATVLGTAASLGIAGMKRTSRLVITQHHLYPGGQPRDHHRHLPDAAVCGLPAVCGGCAPGCPTPSWECPLC